MRLSARSKRILRLEQRFRPDVQLAIAGDRAAGVRLINGEL